jgi:hypothetical protein
VLAFLAKYKLQPPADLLEYDATDFDNRDRARKARQVENAWARMARINATVANVLGENQARLQPALRIRRAAALVVIRRHAGARAHRTDCHQPPRRRQGRYRTTACAAGNSLNPTVKLEELRAMTEDPTRRAKIELVASDTGEKHPTDVFNDLEGLRKQSKLTVQRKTVLINVPVDRPANNVYFRVHPDPEMRLDDSTVLRDNSGTRRPYYYVVPAMRTHPKLVQRLRRVTIALIYIWPGGQIQLWPVPILGDSPLASQKSARVAFELGQTVWTSIVWNEERNDYDVESAEKAVNKEPVWPDRTMGECLKLGFADNVIDNEDHPYVLQLRGVFD